MRQYTVQPGDTLGGIAERFDVSVEALARTNALSGLDGAPTGLLLNVPDPSGQEDAIRSVNGSQSVDGPQSVDDLKRSVVVLSPEAKKEVAFQVIEALPAEAKKDIASQSVQTLPNEVKKDIATEAVQNLPTEDKKDIATRAMQALPAQDQQDLTDQFAPSQGEVDRIWQIIVWSFAIVFVLSALALFAAIFLQSARVDTLLTVVTTITGVLAGFVSGRASSIASTVLSRRGSGGFPG